MEEDVRTGQDTTRPDAVCGEGVQSGSADVLTGKPSGGGDSTARKRDKSEKDVLLDSNGQSGSQQDEGELSPQNDTSSGLGEGREEQEAFENVMLPAPSTPTTQRMSCKNIRY